ERRGPGFRMDYQYAWKEGMRGGIKYQQFFERDARDPENESGSLSAHEIRPSELHPKRYKFQLNHNQQLDDRSRLIVSALSYSDSQFHKEYELVEKPNLTAQQFSANINRQYTKGSVTLSASQNRLFSELALLNRNIVSEPIYIPVISFQFSDVLLRSGETTLSRGVSGSATQWFTNQGSSGEEVSISPELSLVFLFFRHFNGSLGISETFSRASSRNPNVPGSKKGEFQIMRGNAQIGTTLSRIFSRESGYYSRIKHLLSTTLHYDYIEDVEGSGQSTRRLTTLRLNNTLLAKRRYFERGLSSQIRSQTREGKSWTLASLNFVQHYDNLKEDPYFQSIGEAIKGNETEPGQPLIPLRTSFGFNPGPGFFVNYFNRYHHQKRQVVEYSATVSVGLSTHNKASVNFRNNEEAYQTPYGIDVDVANTFSFSNSFEASDELAFGFSGTVNIDADTYTFRRRLSSSEFTLDYRPDCWNIRLVLTENVGTTLSNSGREQEYIDRTLYAYINLGGISIPEQIFPELD
ncbi:MAG: LPS-assembly protein LptD, partial [SAR324 cluster bacterium]|nr:LPS-assembly protein LptD [SAR324 cluster bacterium]